MDLGGKRGLESPYSVNAKTCIDFVPLGGKEHGFHCSPGSASSPSDKYPSYADGGHLNDFPPCVP